MVRGKLIVYIYRKKAQYLFYRDNYFAFLLLKHQEYEIYTRQTTLFQLFISIHNSLTCCYNVHIKFSLLAAELLKHSLGKKILLNLFATLTRHPMFYTPVMKLSTGCLVYIHIQLIYCSFITWFTVTNLCKSLSLMTKYKFLHVRTRQQKLHSIC